jgi:predicted dithiol-disulfide oxidoreductase (DUF899 family)
MPDRQVVARDEQLNNAYQYLDLTAKGRDEDETSYLTLRRGYAGMTSMRE